MDIEKLIERLGENTDCWTDKVHGYADLRLEAATALSTLQAENEKLKDQLYDGEGVNLVNYWMQQAKIEENGHRNCQAENEKLRAELEQVKRECDAAQSLLAEQIGVRGAEPITTAFGLPLDRLRELAQADRDGRCVVFPAGIGDTVYHITTCKNFSQVLDGTMYGPDGELGTATGLYCPCELAKTCPFPCDDDGSFDCEKHKNTLSIFEDVVAGVFIEDMQDVITFGYSGSADFEDFGKTVFLTRAEAEAALRMEQE